MIAPKMAALTGAAQRSHITGAKAFSRWISSQIKVARLCGYIDRIREAEHVPEQHIRTVAGGMSAADLVGLPDPDFGEAVDTMTPGELASIMGDDGTRTEYR